MFKIKSKTIFKLFLLSAIVSLFCGILVSQEGQELSASEQIIEDNDAGWKFTQGSSTGVSWHLQKSGNIHSGGTYTQVFNQTIKYTFSGDHVEVYGCAASWTRDDVEITVDDSPVFITNWRASEVAPQKLIWSSSEWKPDGLGGGEHTLTVRLGFGSILLDYIKVIDDENSDEWPLETRDYIDGHFFGHSLMQYVIGTTLDTNDSASNDQNEKDDIIWAGNTGHIDLGSVPTFTRFFAREMGIKSDTVFYRNTGGITLWKKVENNAGFLLEGKTGSQSIAIITENNFTMGHLIFVKDSGEVEYVLEYAPDEVGSGLGGSSTDSAVDTLVKFVNQMRTAHQINTGSVNLPVYVYVNWAPILESYTSTYGRIFEYDKYLTKDEDKWGMKHWLPTVDDGESIDGVQISRSDWNFIFNRLVDTTNSYLMSYYEEYVRLANERSDMIGPDLVIVPAGPIVLKMFQDVVEFEGYQTEKLFYDEIHGEEEMYYLLGLVHCMALHGQKIDGTEIGTPDGFTQDQVVAAVDYIWDELVKYYSR